MKKLYLLAALPLLVLTSCGGNQEVDGGTDREGNTVVKIMFHVDESSDEGGAYKKRIEAFNKAYKSQKIKASASYVARTSGTTSYESTLIAMKQAGTLPSIITFDAPNCAAYANSKLILDITNVFSSNEKDDFLSLNEYKGRVYGIPIQESSAGFYYNKDIFNKAGIDVSGYNVENPWTFDQFKSVCGQLKTYMDGVNPTIPQGEPKMTPVDMRLDATQDEMATYLLYPLINAAGGEFVNPNDGKQARGYMNSAASKSGFQFIKDLINSRYTSYAIGATDFFDGKVGMYLSSGWTIPQLEIKYEKPRDTWGLLPYPKSVKAASATGSWSYGLTKDSEAARELLKFLSTTESAQVVTDATGMIPAHKSMGNDYTVGSAEYVLRKQLELSGTPRPETVGYNAFSTAFRNIISGLNTGEVDGVVEGAVNEFQDELDRIVIRV